MGILVVNPVENLPGFLNTPREYKSPAADDRVYFKSKDAIVYREYGTPVNTMNRRGKLIEKMKSVTKGEQLRKRELALLKIQAFARGWLARHRVYKIKKPGMMREGEVIANGERPHMYPGIFHFDPKRGIHSMKAEEKAEMATYAIEQKAEKRRRVRLGEGSIMNLDEKADPRSPRARDVIRLSPKLRSKAGSKSKSSYTLKQMLADMNYSDEDYLSSSVDAETRAANIKRTRNNLGKQNWGNFVSKLDAPEVIAKREAAHAREINELIATKAMFKFRNLRDAFRLVDVDKSGSVSRAEMHTFFRQFNLAGFEADVLFNQLDQDDSGELNYIEFMEYFGPVIQPGSSPDMSKISYKSPLVGAYHFENNATGYSLRKLG